MLAGLQYDGEDSHLLCDQDGRLSMSRIIASDVSLKPILSVGATYTYVPRRVFRKFEGLDLIAQGAGNYIQGVAKAEHDVQQLMKIATRIEQEMPFSKIRENLKKSKCLNMEALQGMFQFLRKFGGEPKNLHAARSTAHKIRAEGDTKRRVGQDIWDALGLDYKVTSNSMACGMLLLVWSIPIQIRRLYVPQISKTWGTKQTWNVQWSLR